MRIAFDVSALRGRHSGVATYTQSLLRHLERLPHADDEIVPMDHAHVWLPTQTSPHASGRYVNKTLWMQAILPFQLSRLAADVCHFTNSVGSWWTPCPSVLTIHDTTLWMFPRYHPKRRLLAMRPFIPLAARQAKAIIAVSASTKRDVVRTLGVREAKVHIVHEAPAPHFRPLAPNVRLDMVRRAYGVPDAFILYVGTIEPRKNLRRLLEAFAFLRRQGYPSLGLVLAGSRGWSDAVIFRSIERLGLGNSVRVLGYVPTHDLVALYNLADALAFPSLYEGFGLPVVEAMACGTPVVASPNGSLGEVVGSAAELVDPASADSIAAGLRRVLSDPDHRAELRAAGLVQAARYSWHVAAEQTRRVYESVLQQAS